MNLLELLLGSMMENNSINALSGNAGTTPDQTSSLVSSALPLLLNAMTNNASSQEGALSLLNALGEHNDTADMATQLAGADMDDGSAIISHILGDNTGSMINLLAGQNGISNEQTSSLLSSMAPALLSSLSSATNEAQAQAQAQTEAETIPLEPLMDDEQSAFNGSGLLSTLLSFLG